MVFALGANLKGQEVMDNLSFSVRRGGGQEESCFSSSKLALWLHAESFPASFSIKCLEGSV